MPLQRPGSTAPKATSSKAAAAEDSSSESGESDEGRIGLVGLEMFGVGSTCRLFSFVFRVSFFLCAI